jgi:hypothetical protein
MVKIISILFLFISIALPADHVNTTLVYSTNFFGLKLLYIDLFFIFLLTFNLIFLKKLKKSDLIIFSFILFIFLLSFFHFLSNSNSFKQLLYDFRPILYLGVLTFNKTLFDFKEQIVFYVIISALFFYSTICFSYFFLGPESSSIFENVNLGRIAFHNDYFLLICIPLTIYAIFKMNFNFFVKFVFLIFLISFIFKLFISMGRGITFFVSFSVLLMLVKDFRFIKLKYIPIFIIFLISLYFLFIFIYSFVLGDSADVLYEYAISRYDTSSEGFKENQLINRSTMIITGFKEFIESPFLGHGAGYTFNIDSKEWDGNISFVDSSLITSLIRFGFIGTFLLYFILFTFFYRIKEQRKLKRIFYNVEFFNILYRSLIVIIIYSLFNSLLVASYSIVGFYWLLTWIYYKYNNDKNFVHLSTPKNLT